MQTAAVLRHLAACVPLTLLSAAIVWLMIRAGPLDMPDAGGPGARKTHARPTPKGGGVGIAAAFLSGVVMLYAFASYARLADGYFLAVIGAAAMIAAVAYLDDLRDWPFGVKLSAQMLAAAISVGAGLYVQDFRVPGLGTVDLGLAGALVTLLWVLFATNAMNFIDGTDGLAGGVTFVACGFLAYIGGTRGAWFVYAGAMLLGAGVLGFLPFNVARARIFMGDVGSQFCGFMLAVLGVAAARFGDVPLSFLLVPMLLSGVLWDVCYTLVRRARRRERLTAAHRGHLYQRAQAAGVPALPVAALHWGFTAYGGAACLAFLAAPPAWQPLVPLSVLPPQLAWTGYVARLERARRPGWSTAARARTAAAPGSPPSRPAGSP